MAGASLLELKREWLPKIYEFEPQGADCTFYNMSVAPTTVGMEWDKDGKLINEGKPGFRWDGSFNIRYGNTTVHLHSDGDDSRLKRFDKKLKSLSMSIKAYLKECERRLKRTEKKEPTTFRREWLNPLDKDTPYTGYFFYEINPNLGGKFLIADCHRSIIVWMDDMNMDLSPGTVLFAGGSTGGVTITEDNYALKMLRNKWAFLKAIADELDSAGESITKLRARLQNGELKAKMAADSDKIVVKREALVIDV